MQGCLREQKHEFKEIQGYVFSRNFKECVNPVADVQSDSELCKISDRYYTIWIINSFDKCENKIEPGNNQKIWDTNDCGNITIANECIVKAKEMLITVTNIKTKKVTLEVADDKVEALFDVKMENKAKLAKIMINLKVKLMYSTTDNTVLKIKLVQDE